MKDQDSWALVLVVLCLLFSACDGNTDSNHQPAPTGTPTATASPTPRPTRGYSLAGTANGESAHGRFVIAFAMIEPNLLRYDVVSFLFADLNGSGTAELFTLSNTFTINVSAVSDAGAEVQLTGSAPVLQTLPLTFGEFNLTGQGYTLAFSATGD